MAVLSLPLSFTNSFWSQDYRRGLEVLYAKLEQGVAENDEIVAFVRARALAERQLADALTNPMLTGAAGMGFGTDDGASLLMAFRGLQAESVTQGQAHKTIANELETLVADPFDQWAQSYKDRLHQSKGSTVDYWLRSYEQAHGEVSKLKHQYLAKTRRADEAEDDAKFAPNSGGKDTYTTSPRVRPADGHRTPPLRTASVSERIAQRLREIQKKSINAVAAATEAAKADVPEEAEEKLLPKIDKGKGKATDEEPIIASPPPMSPLLPPKVDIAGSPMPPMPPPPMLLAGLSLPPVAVSQLLTRAAAELPLRPVRFPLLGEYPDCFTGEEFVAWLNENVHGFGGSLDRAEDAAKELTERDNLLRRIGEFGNSFEHSDEAFYQFRPKAFDLDGKNAEAATVGSPIKTLQPENLIKRTNTFVNLVSKALSTQNAESAYMKARHEADDADNAFRVATRKLDRQRLGLEERIEETLKMLQRWEIERLRAVKTVLLQYHGTVSNLPKSLEPSNELSGTLIAAYLPESDLNALIERYRTGPFRPEAQVYESVSHIETDVVFGIDLRRWAEGGWDAVSSGEPRKHEIPPVVTALLSALTEAYGKLPNDIEKRKSWIYEVPLPAVHHLREALNGVPLDEPVPMELLASYDAPVIAGTIKLWLLELDPPLALWEGWDDIRRLYPTVGAAAKADGDDTEALRITDLGTALQRLPRVHLYVLDALVSHLRTLIETTTVEETEEMYITKLALSVGRTILRPKFETEMSIQDRHPTLLFMDLVKNYAAIIPPTIARKKRESERKIPIRKRTAPVDMRLSRSRISVGADTKQLLAAQQVAQNPSLHKASRSIDVGVPPVPPVPPMPPAFVQAAPPPPPLPVEKPVEKPVEAPGPPPFVPPPFVPPPPPPALPTAPKDADQPARPSFKEPPPELDDDLPLRPAFKEPPPESPDPTTPPMPRFADPPPEESEAPSSGVSTSPSTVVIPPTPQKSDSRNGSRVASPTKIGSRSASPVTSDPRASLTRSSSGQGAVRGPRGARGPRPPTSGNVQNLVSTLNRKNSIGSPPSSPSYKRLSGSPGRPSSVLGRAAAFSTRTMESDAEDNVVEKK